MTTMAIQDSTGMPSSAARWKPMKSGLIWSALTQAPPDSTKVAPR